MFRPQDIVIVCKPCSPSGKAAGSVMVWQRGEVPPGKGVLTYGAVCSHWRELTDDQCYQALAWLAMELAEFKGVPMRLIRDRFEERIQGFREWCRTAGSYAVGMG